MKDNEEFAHLLSEQPLPKILPNLRILSIYIRDRPKSPSNFFENIMQGLELRELSITLDPDAIGCDEPIEDMMAALTAAVRGVSQNLHKFSLEGPQPGYHDWTEHQEQVTQLLKDLPRLKSLEVQNLGESFAEQATVASGMVGLKEITLISTGALVPEETSFPLHGFTSVTSVDFGRIPVHAIETLLASIQSSKVETLCLSAEPQHTYHDEELPLTVGLGGYLTRWIGLKHIYLDLEGGIIGWEDILPLLSCRDMEDVSLIFIGSAVVLGDVEIELMAQAWPHLELLEIDDPNMEYGGDPDDDEELTATLLGLIPLAQHCPSLKSLSISVDTCGVDEADPCPYIAFNVKHLNLQWSRASLIEESDADAIAEFIARMWPNHDSEEQRTKWETEGGDGDQIEAWTEILEVVDFRLEEA